MHYKMKIKLIVLDSKLIYFAFTLHNLTSQIDDYTGLIQLLD